MEFWTEFLKFATALVLFAIAVLKLRSTSEASGSNARKDEEGRDSLQ